MNVGKLKKALERLEDDTEVLVWDSYHEFLYNTHELTIDTDMRTGEIKLVICGTNDDPGPAPKPGNLRDYEPHPAFEDFNKWQWEGM